MNKKGQIGATAILIISLIIGAIVLFSGWLSAFKLNQMINSIPPYGWAIIILILLILIFRRNK